MDELKVKVNVTDIYEFTVLFINYHLLYVMGCVFKVHAHPCRCGHHPSPLDIRYRGYQSRPSFSGNREKLQLLAVLCIETSHYVSFVKYGPRPDQWLFYDSMADREGKTS